MHWNISKHFVLSCYITSKFIFYEEPSRWSLVKGQTTRRNSLPWEKQLIMLLPYFDKRWPSYWLKTDGGVQQGNQEQRTSLVFKTAKHSPLYTASTCLHATLISWNIAFRNNMLKREITNMAGVWLLVISVFYNWVNYSYYYYYCCCCCCCCC